MADQEPPYTTPHINLGDTDPFYAFLERTDTKLKLPKGFFLGLLNEPTDWAFCVKLHALAESAVNATLHKAIRNPALNWHISKLSMRIKIEMAKAVNALEKDEAQFLRTLGDVRNPIAHQVAHIPDFALTTKLPAPGSKERKHLVGTADVRPDDLRAAILGRALGVLIHLEYGEAKLEAQFAAEINTALELRDDAVKIAIAQLLDGPPGEAESDG